VRRPMSIIVDLKSGQGRAHCPRCPATSLFATPFSFRLPAVATCPYPAVEAGPFWGRARPPASSSGRPSSLRRSRLKVGRERVVHPAPSRWYVMFRGQPRGPGRAEVPVRTSAGPASAGLPATCQARGHPGRVTGGPWLISLGLVTGRICLWLPRVVALLLPTSTGSRSFLILLPRPQLDLGCCPHARRAPASPVRARRCVAFFFPAERLNLTQNRRARFARFYPVVVARLAFSPAAALWIWNVCHRPARASCSLRPRPVGPPDAVR